MKSNRKETSPFFPGGRIRIHKGFKDPSEFEGADEEILANFRMMRDQIREWIEEEFKPNEPIN